MSSKRYPCAPSSKNGPGNFQRKTQNEPQSLRKLAEESGLDESTLRRRLKKGMTLDEAMTLVRARGGRKPPAGLGRSGGKDEYSFHQYFVDALRVAMDKDPLYRQK